VWILREFVIW